MARCAFAFSLHLPDSVRIACPSLLYLVSPSLVCCMITFWQREVPIQAQPIPAKHYQLSAS